MRSYKHSSIHADLATIIFWAGMATLVAVWCDRANLDLLALLWKSFGF